MPGFDARLGRASGSDFVRGLLAYLEAHGLGEPGLDEAALSGCSAASARTSPRSGGTGRPVQGGESRFGLWADDAVNEFPFAPPHYLTKTEGIAAIRAYMKGFPANIEVVGVPWIKVRHTTEPDVVITEDLIEGTAPATGNPRNLRYVCVIESKDGKTARCVGDRNALEAATALGGRDAFPGAVNATTLA